MSTLINTLSSYGVVPVVKIDRIEDALPLAKALISGGLPIAEVTFRTSCAKEAIKLMSDNYPEMIIGAGTVITTEQVDDAIEAGAQFIVSPGLNPVTVKYCQEKNIPIVPGVTSPGEIEVALGLGLTDLKFFPAEAAGGIKMLKALAGPYTGVKFMPTGGVNSKNINEYLSFDKILCCGGTWMVDPALILAGDFDAIEKLTKEAVATVLNLQLLHIGINDPSSANEFASLLGEDLDERSKSWFVGNSIEVMKEKYLGSNGHIAYSTADINRAKSYFERKGYSFLSETAAYNEKGKLKSIYLEKEIGGFAIHLVQK